MVFRFPPDPRRDFLDRCIGLPEDTIEIRNKQVILDGQPVDQPYAVYRDPETYPPDAPRGLGKRDNMTPLTVPEGSYFCLGDNRDQSFDSRFWGGRARREPQGATPLHLLVPGPVACRQETG
jgi:signal peptidase I